MCPSLSQGLKTKIFQCKLIPKLWKEKSIFRKLQLYSVKTQTSTFVDSENVMII